MAKAQLVDLDFQGTSKATGLPTPTQASDAVNKAYVDSAVEGLAWKDSVRVSAPANVNLTAPGATIDGVTMAANDRFLAPNQTTTTQNGIYVYNGSGVPATRALDASTGPELEQAITTVEEGTSAGSTFRQTQVNFVIDTGSPVFVPFGTAAPSASETAQGIAELATQAEVDTGTDTTRIVTPEKLKNSKLFNKSVPFNVGDGSATSYVLSHNLNTRDVIVQVFRNSGNYDEVVIEAERTTVNSVTIRFTTAPALNAFRAVVQATLS